MDYTIHGIPQARMLEWVAVSCSRGSSQPRDGIQVSCIAGRFFFFFLYLFILLHQVFSCSMWDLIPLPRIEPRPPALVAWSLSHWTTREIP